jgi:probable F420-dependent oxidoreductase
MKFGLIFARATSPLALSGDQVLETLEALATTSEDVGFESLWAADHSVVPIDYRSRYPYSGDGRLPGQPDTPIPDPMLLLTFAAALTRRLRLATGVMILPQRHPIYVAKAFATLDVLSRGRAIAGVGIGWLKEEFDALGVPFSERAARTEESIQAMKSLWRPGAEAFEGHFYRWPAVESNPKPVGESGVPVVIGGHSEAAARRAARVADGLFAAVTDLGELALLLGKLRDECQRVGRDPAEIEISIPAGELDEDRLARCEDLGVARLIVSPSAYESAEIRRGLETFADRFLVRATG